MATRADPWMEAREEAFIRHQKGKAAGTPEPNSAPTDGADAGATNPTTDTSTADQGSDTEKPPEATPSAQDTATPTDAGTTEAPPDGTAAAPEGDEGAAAEPPSGIDPETLATISSAYGDQLLETTALKERYEEAVKRGVQLRAQEFQDTQREDAEVTALVRQGRDAYQGMVSLLESARDELNTAAQGTEDVKFNPNILDEHALEQFDSRLQTFGSAIVAEQRGYHRRDLDQAFIGAIKTLPALSEPQKETLRTILNNARRMERDPQQSTAAFGYAINQLVSFVVDHARTAGSTEEGVRAQQRSQVAQKIATSNAAKAAAAKLAATRGNVPPEGPSDAGATPAGDAGEATQAHYEARKRAGAQPVELDQIVAAMARKAASGVPV